MLSSTRGRQDEATCLAKPMDHFIATGSRGQFGAADYVLRSKRSRWVSLFGRYFFDLLRDKKIIRSNQWSRKRSPFNNKEEEGRGEETTEYRETIARRYFWRSNRFVEEDGVRCSLKMSRRWFYVWKPAKIFLLK